MQEGKTIGPKESPLSNFLHKYKFIYPYVLHQCAKENPQLLIDLVRSGDLTTLHLSEAAESLGRCGSEEALGLLLGLLKHESPCVREGAVRGFYYFWHIPFVTRLLKDVLEKDTDSKVRATAREMITFLESTGNDDL